MRSEGLFDLQVNGYAGVDFNSSSLTAKDLDHALEAMLADGVTGCLPTLITASPRDLEERFLALDAAVRGSRLGQLMVPGYHLEGPFLNDAPGYCGCHPPEVMSDPDVELVARLESKLSLPIMLITLAPERAGAFAAIRHWKSQGKTLGISHSAADFRCVAEAAEAGLTLSTHLGNGLPQTLPKLENTLLAQLAEPRLTACLIPDGLHIPPEALRALVRLKGPKNCVLVTDAVLAAAMPAGIYNFGGMEVARGTDGRVTQPGGTGLAGSALQLDQGVRNIVAWSIASPGEAVGMASTAARSVLADTFKAHEVEISPGEIEWDDNLKPRLIRKPELSRRHA